MELVRRSLLRTLNRDTIDNFHLGAGGAVYGILSELLKYKPKLFTFVIEQEIKQKF